VAAAAAIDPFRTCKATLDGFLEEMKERGGWDTAAMLLFPATHGYSEEYGIQLKCSDGWAYDRKMVNMICRWHRRLDSG